MEQCFPCLTLSAAWFAIDVLKTNTTDCCCMKPEIASARPAGTTAGTADFGTAWEAIATPGGDLFSAHTDNDAPFSSFTETTEERVARILSRGQVTSRAKQHASPVHMVSRLPKVINSNRHTHLQDKNSIHGCPKWCCRME